MKCPKCGNELLEVNGYFACKYCNAFFKLDDDYDGYDDYDDELENVDESEPVDANEKVSSDFSKPIDAINDSFHMPFGDKTYGSEITFVEEHSESIENLHNDNLIDSSANSNKVDDSRDIRFFVEDNIDEVSYNPSTFNERPTDNPFGCDDRVDHIEEDVKVDNPSVELSAKDESALINMRNECDELKQKNLELQTELDYLKKKINDIDNKDKREVKNKEVNKEIKDKKKDTDEHETSELKKRINDLEAKHKILENKVYKMSFAGKWASFKAFMQAGALKFIIVLAILATAITLMVCFIGVRGVYVNVDDPDDFYSFTPSKYTVYYQDFTGETSTESGKWKVSDNKITFSTTDDLFGDVKYSYYFKKDGNGTIYIGEEADLAEEYKRVQLTPFSSNNKKVKVVFDANGGEGGYAVRVKIGSIFNDDTPEVSREGYTFMGWYTEPDGYLSTDSTRFTEGERIWEKITYYANWKEKETLRITLNGSLLCTQKEGNPILESIISSDKNRKEGYYYEYYIDDEIITSETLMPSHNVTITRKMIKVYSRVGDTILFGEYPQSLVSDSTLETSLNDLAGTLPTSSYSRNWASYGYYISGNISNYMWYIDVEYDTEKYRGVYFTNYRPYFTTYSSSSGNSYQSDNGYYTNTIYWFKYEPIKWQILDEKNGNALLLCDIAIDSQNYYTTANGNTRIKDRGTVYENNYEYSTIRSWLNDTFYDTTFSEYQKKIISITSVVNSASSAGSDDGLYVCSNTKDAVFLLSYAEVEKYNLSTESGQRKSTDYAKSQGCLANTSDYNGNCWWWLRSPFTRDSYYARYIYYNGEIYDEMVNYTYMGVVPSLWIKL